MASIIPTKYKPSLFCTNTPYVSDIIAIIKLSIRTIFTQMKMMWNTYPIYAFSPNISYSSPKSQSPIAEINNISNAEYILSYF